MDTIVRLHLHQMGCKINRYVVVAIDPVTRWVELGSVLHLTSHKVALWFHAEIVCRYGLPVVVRTDKGSEYKGEFDMYMCRNGVEH